MCTNNHVSHAGSPLRWKNFRSATALFRPIVAMLPLSKYRNASAFRADHSQNVARCVAALLHRHGRDSRQGLSSLMRKICQVANHLHFRMSGNGEVVVYNNSAKAVNRCDKGFPHERGNVAGRPDLHVAWDEFALQLHARFCNVRCSCVRAHVHAQLDQFPFLTGSREAAASEDFRELDGEEVRKAVHREGRSPSSSRARLERPDERGELFLPPPGNPPDGVDEEEVRKAPLRAPGPKPRASTS